MNIFGFRGRLWEFCKAEVDQWVKSGGADDGKDDSRNNEN